MSDRHLGDGAAVVMAVAGAAGALGAFPLPRWPGIVACAAALTLRRPVLLVAGVAVLTSALGARAEAGLVWTDTVRHDGPGVLVGDPARVAGAVRVDVRLAGRRVEAWAGGPAARALAERRSGEVVELHGWAGPAPRAARARLAARSIGGRLSVDEVGPWRPGNVPSRAANAFRRLLDEGARTLPPEVRGLFAGLVLGDDRDQPVELVEDFRASGLSHLLVVSGQNVAYVLALAGPVLRRLRLGARFGASLALLALFGVLTRWEPSVLRAVAMAAITLLATTLGRPVSALRVLALAVTALLLLDPLLVRSLGFGLSVGATTGIVLLAGPLRGRLPGPAWLTGTAAVTLAAQAGVAPLLVPVFGGLPVASLPANLIAVPVAGLVLLWGIPGGLLAGVAGEPLAVLVHLPTRVLLAVLAEVARVGAALPLGQVGAGHLVIAAGVVVLAVTARAVGHRRAGTSDLTRTIGEAAAPLPTSRCDLTTQTPPPGCKGASWGGVRVAVAIALASVLVLAPATAARWPPDLTGATVVDGARLWRRGAAVVLLVDGVRAPPGRLLAAVRAVSVRRIDVLVLARAGSGDRRAVAPLLRVLAPRIVLVPPGSGMAGVVVPPEGSRTDAGALSIWTTSAAPRLVVRIESRSSTGP